MIDFRGSVICLFLEISWCVPGWCGVLFDRSMWLARESDSAMAQDATEEKGIQGKIRCASGLTTNFQAGASSFHPP